MSYSSKNGKRPDELASKSSHSHIINDEEVKAFIKSCEYPKSKDEIALDPALVIDIDYSALNPIEHIIAVDGGYSEIPVKKTFPSSTITFFQFGTLLLNTKDLDALSSQPFISRESMSKLKDLERDKLVLPTKNVAYKKSTTLTDSVRLCLYEYFKRKNDGTTLLETLYWFLYHLYDTPIEEYQLASCPHHCGEKNIKIKRADFNSKLICQSCKNCKQEIFITDVFRFHEVVDDELGAGGILGYMTNLLEHFNIIHTIKNIKSLKNVKTDLLHNFLFIKDGPLAFFGQTANMHKPMRNLCNYLSTKHNLFIAGLEKSGAFVEHAEEIKSLLNPGQALLLSNKHIYSYILPGEPETPDAYGRTSYYSSKLIFKSRDERMHVITIPVENENIVINPQKDDFKNIDSILWNIERLRCDMYDNAIVPVALANKLISLSNHPSSAILEKFAKANMK
jgi:hypothetical protein